MAIQAPRFPPYKPRINPYKWRALAHTSAKRKPITQRDDPYKPLQGTIPTPYKLQALPKSFPGDRSIHVLTADLARLETHINQ